MKFIKKSFIMSPFKNRYLPSTTLLFSLFFISFSSYAQHSSNQQHSIKNSSTRVSAPISSKTSSTLKRVGFIKNNKTQTFIKLEFDGAVPEVLNTFKTQKPYSIVLDFNKLNSSLPKHYLFKNQNHKYIKGYSLVSANNKTRFVLNLTQNKTYHITHKNNSILVSLEKENLVKTPVSIAVSKNNSNIIKDINFKRLNNHSGKLIILSSKMPQIDIDKNSKVIIIKLQNSFVDNKTQNFLNKKTNLYDFGTPVKYFDVYKNKGSHLISINIASSDDMSVNKKSIKLERNKVKTIIKLTSLNSYKHAKNHSSSRAHVLFNDTPSKYISSNGYKHNQANLNNIKNPKKISLNFQNIPVRAVLQIIAEASQMNVVIANSVNGDMTLNLKNVSWVDALKTVLRSQGLAERMDGNIIWVAPQDVISNYEESIAQSKQKEQATAPLISTYIPISYGSASDIAKLLTSGSLGSSGDSASSSKHGFLSPRGSVSFDERTNTLLINDTPSKTHQIEKLVGVLDKPVKQVKISSRIVVATNDFTRELGVKWGMSGSKRKHGGQILQIGGNMGDDMSNNSSSGTLGGDMGYNVNLPISSPAGAIGVSILGNNYALGLELQAAQTEGQTEIISSPSVITANQKEANIRQGQEIGYVTYQGNGGNQTASVQFKDAVLELKVTPTITSDGRVFLKINVKKDSLSAFIDTPNGKVPQINTQSVNTSVLVKNGQTVVLGGIYELNKNKSVTKVPWLGDLPIIGALFRTRQHASKKAELLIFVTPDILTNTNNYNDGDNHNIVYKDLTPTLNRLEQN